MVSGIHTESFCIHYWPVAILTTLGDSHPHLENREAYRVLRRMTLLPIELVAMIVNPGRAIQEANPGRWVAGGIGILDGVMAGGVRV